MIDLPPLKAQLEVAFPEAQIETVQNGSPSGQHSLLFPVAHALRIAQYLRDTPGLRFDFLSNVTGVDWPDLKIKETTKAKEMVDGVERLIERSVERVRPGFLEVVYHLYSMELKQGPLIFRLRTTDRGAGARLPSMTGLWRGAEFQEREIYDLYGVIFEGHPDLRRILMWEGFADFPMRKDYVPPDDYEYEPTPHDEVAARAQQHDSAKGKI